MIPQAYITAWRKHAPWQEDYQVEQDLIIHRSIIALFSDNFIRERLAFRGGTALHKLFLTPAVRYSEDIDLVQVKAEPFGPIFDKIKERLSFLGDPRINQKQHNNTLVYRFSSEDNVPIKLKVEVNTREHFSVFGLNNMSVKLDSEWVKDEAEVPVFSLEELLATKLRALYQRKKGRDLFDLWYAINNAEVNAERVIKAFRYYLQAGGTLISKKLFIENIEKKIRDKNFIGDTNGLFRPGVVYDADEAYKKVRKVILDKL